MSNANKDDANYEDIYDDIVIDADNNLTSAIDPLQNEIIEIKGVDAENEGLDNGGGVTVNSNALPPEKNYIYYGILPTSTTMMKYPINALWDGATWLLVPVTSIILPWPMPTLLTPSLPF